MVYGRFFNLSAASPTAVNAQELDPMQQNQPVAEAARQNREQEKNLVRRARVISDDDLDRE